MTIGSNNKKGEVTAGVKIVLSVVLPIAVIIACVVMAFAAMYGVGVRSGASGDIVATEDADSESEAYHASDGDENRFAFTKLPVPEDEVHVDMMAVIVDKETGIEYLYTFDKAGSGSGTAITMLCNPDGTPKISSEYATVDKNESS